MSSIGEDWGVVGVGGRETADGRGTSTSVLSCASPLAQAASLLSRCNPRCHSPCSQSARQLVSGPRSFASKNITSWLAIAWGRSTRVEYTTPQNTKSWAQRPVIRVPRWRRAPRRTNPPKRARRMRNPRSKRLPLSRCLPTRRL